MAIIRTQIFKTKLRGNAFEVWYWIFSGYFTENVLLSL